MSGEKARRPFPPENSSDTPWPPPLATGFDLDWHATLDSGQMLGAPTKAAEPQVIVLPGSEPSIAWRQIVETAHPFLEAVAVRLEEQVNAFDPEISAYARYALTNQGKQMRPALVALSAGATGELNDSHVTVAVIIEMVHLATLVHDDVMDAAEIRRRRATLAANW